jgi:hypothetical protein
MSYERPLGKFRPNRWQTAAQVIHAINLLPPVGMRGSSRVNTKIGRLLDDLLPCWIKAIKGTSRGIDYTKESLRIFVPAKSIGSWLPN